MHRDRDAMARNAMNDRIPRVPNSASSSKHKEGDKVITYCLGENRVYVALQPDHEVRSPPSFPPSLPHSNSLTNSFLAVSDKPSLRSLPNRTPQHPPHTRPIPHRSQTQRPTPHSPRRRLTYSLVRCHIPDAAVRDHIRACSPA